MDAIRDAMDSVAKKKKKFENLLILHPDASLWKTNAIFKIKCQANGLIDKFKPDYS